MVLHRILARGEAALGVLELAPFRVPRMRAVGLRLWQRSGVFLKRAGTVILAMFPIISLFMLRWFY